MTGQVGHVPLASYNGPSQRIAQQASTAQKQDVLGAIMAEMKGEEESIHTTAARGGGSIQHDLSAAIDIVCIAEASWGGR